MSNKIKNILRKFVIVALSLVVAGTNSGYSADTEVELSQIVGL